MPLHNSQTMCLASKFLNLRLRDCINFSFLTVAELPNNKSYFPHALEDEFSKLESSGFKYIPYKSKKTLEDIDVLILTAHGNDLYERILELKSCNPNLIIATWFFDNHLAHLQNYKTAIVSDIYYPSHAYRKDYLMNPYSPLGPDMPACTAQWASNELDFEDVLSNSTRHAKIFLNYVDYKFSWRSQLLDQLRKFMPNAQVQAMQPENRDRYFSLTPLQKYQEWCSYKATLILPVDRDLSTRVFDALFAGQVLIVPTIIEDFDNVISRDWQNKLGIIRIKDLDLATIQFAANKAFEIFDNRGQDGLVDRFKFVSEGHMLKNRIEAILKNIQSISRGSESIKTGVLFDCTGLLIS